jgi:rare lipoprotein A
MHFGFLIFLAVMGLATSASGEDRVSASWYGDELSGKLTASGERFNPSGLTAAHRTLPFGTCLVVTNPRNGKSVNVRVNDRGPFVKDRVLDVAAGVARAIGMVATQIVSMRHCWRTKSPTSDDASCSCFRAGGIKIKTYERRSGAP